MIADILTVSRMLLSIFLLVISPFSTLFGIIYLLCGATDVLDGFAARTLHTESEYGARLDSLADLFFSAVYLVKIIPVLSVPLRLWFWTAMIAAVKVSGILLASIKAHRFLIAHSFGNKLTGVLLFLLPLSVYVADVSYGATLVCAAATVTAVREIVLSCGRPKMS